MLEDCCLGQLNEGREFEAQTPIQCSEVADPRPASRLLQARQHVLGVPEMTEGGDGFNGSVNCPLPSAEHEIVVIRMITTDDRSPHAHHTIRLRRTITELVRHSPREWRQRPALRPGEPHAAARKTGLERVESGHQRRWIVRNDVNVVLERPVVAGGNRLAYPFQQLCHRRCEQQRCQGASLNNSSVRAEHRMLSFIKTRHVFMIWVDVGTVVG